MVSGHHPSCGDRYIKAVRTDFFLFKHSHQLAQLLCLLNRLIVLRLCYFSAVQHLLYLRLRISLEVLPELIKPADKIIVALIKLME